MAVPPKVKATTVSVELVATCVTVKVAIVGPVSEPFSVPATETVDVIVGDSAARRGRVHTDAGIAAGDRRNERDGDCLRGFHHRVVDHGDRDGSRGAVGGNRDGMRDGGVIGTFCGGAPQREGHHRIGGTGGALRDREGGAGGSVSEPFSVPATETVAVSLSVIFTVPLPAVLTEAVLVGAERVTPGNDSGPSTN